MILPQLPILDRTAPIKKLRENGPATSLAMQRGSHKLSSTYDCFGTCFLYSTNTVSHGNRRLGESYIKLSYSNINS
jgi:hypothetical protein